MRLLRAQRPLAQWELSPFFPCRFLDHFKSEITLSEIGIKNWKSVLFVMKDIVHFTEQFPGGDFLLYPPQNKATSLKLSRLPVSTCSGWVYCYGFSSPFYVHREGPFFAVCVGIYCGFYAFNIVCAAEIDWTSICVLATTATTNGESTLLFMCPCVFGSMLLLVWAWFPTFS